MKNKICIVVVMMLLLTCISPVYASTMSTPRVVLPQGEELDSTEMAEIRGEVAPWIIGAAVSGTVDAGINAVDNYLNGARGIEILEGCGKEFVKGAVIGAITAPTKIVTSTKGILTTAKKVYDTSKIGVSVGSGVAGYVAGEIYDKITE